MDRKSSMENASIQGLKCLTAEPLTEDLLSLCLSKRRFLTVLQGKRLKFALCWLIFWHRSSVRISWHDAQDLTKRFSHTSRTKALVEEHESRKHDGKRGRSDEKPEYRVVSLHGSDGAEKQES